MIVRIFRRLRCSGHHDYADSCGNMAHTRIYYRCRDCGFVRSVPYSVETP